MEIATAYRRRRRLQVATNDDNDSARAISNHKKLIMRYGPVRSGGWELALVNLE
uniref:Uncharacterized protein n=1 Tax=Rhizophora mucronata TaxID=61149 RepID=A0A2P2QGH5_RHIMU